ncbi:MAG TPA: sigma-70 family RNA polymerase sigma factor [Gemmataceae bacterium]|jgi:RNA polymerase sigma factor (sigma-70 family)
MAIQMNEFFHRLESAVLGQDGARLTDGQLLARFVEQRDNAAVAALVRRHGPMVWGLCQRVLRNHHDAEDAFQATFLVLARRAAVIAPREMVVNWLYGVAFRTALKARATLAKRRTRERQVMTMPEIAREPQDLRHDLQAVLDQELNRLPDKYRVAIVLCDLEGKSRTEAARQLGVPSGTVAARLTRGRALLGKRLARHGLAVSGAALAAVLSAQAASACRPSSLMSSTIKALTALSTGQAASTGLVSAPVAALTEGMVKTMFLSKVKIATGIVLALTVSAAGGLLYQTQAARPAEEAPRVEQKREDDLRTAAIKALEQFAKSDQARDREAAIKALVDFRKELKVEEARKKAEEARIRQVRERHLASTARDLVDLFMFRVPIELGATEFHEDGRIEIVEVRGTRPRIEVGGQYLVRGKYKLPPGERRGKLYFFVTAAGSWNPGAVVTLDLQSTAVDKPEGEFTLVHGMAGTGHFHLVLADPERYSRMFANVYFGTGDNVLRKKSW